MTTPERSPLDRLWAGWRTTYGSRLFADHVPETDELVVERVRRAGVVVIGKTNVPEFAAAIEDAEGIPITAMPISPSELFTLRQTHSQSHGATS